MAYHTRKEKASFKRGIQIGKRQARRRRSSYGRRRRRYS